MPFFVARTISGQKYLFTDYGKVFDKVNSEEIMKDFETHKIDEKDIRLL